MKRAAVFCGMALAAAVMACSHAANDSSAQNAAFHPLDVGAPVPAYAARTITGDSVRVGGAEQPTVLNVWATWCTSCREEMAALDSLHHEYGASGLRVIGVSVDEGDGDRVKRYAESNHLDFTVAHDPAGDIQHVYALVGVPTTFVIGRDGRLVWSHTGDIGSTFDAARAAVEKALASAR